MKISFTNTPNFGSTINQLISDKEKFLSLGLGEPEIETPQQIKEAAYKALLDGYTKYSNSFGLENLREAISGKLKTENGIDSSVENILVTPGGKNALFISCMGLVNDGDEIINFNPCYVSNLPILSLASRNITVKNIDLISPTFRINRKKFEESITERTRLLLVNFPNNPTGVTLNIDDAEYLASLINDKNIFIISDEVYEKFVYDEKNISLGRLAEIKDKVITVNSFSKSSFMTGWRIGYINANPEIVKELAKINLHINTNTAAFIQMAALEALRMGDDLLNSYKNELKIRRKIFADTIKRIYPEFQLPGGGLFVFLNIEQTKLKSDDFAAMLLKNEKVAVVPGINFGVNFDGYCRISFTCKTDKFEEGIFRIRRFIEGL